MKKKVATNTKLTKTKKITLDDLAVMVGRGFNAVDEQFKGVHKEMSERFDDVELRLERIENRILMNHENRFDRLEDKIRILETSRGR